jgi:hypothetical protein
MQHILQVYTLYTCHEIAKVALPPSPKVCFHPKNLKQIYLIVWS